MRNTIINIINIIIILSKQLKTIHVYRNTVICCIFIWRSDYKIYFIQQKTKKYKDVHQGLDRNLTFKFSCCRSMYVYFHYWQNLFVIFQASYSKRVNIIQNQCFERLDIEWKSCYLLRAWIKYFCSKSRRSKSDSQDKSLSYVWLKSFLETLDGLGLYYYTTAVTQTISPSTMRSKKWQHKKLACHARRVVSLLVNAECCQFILCI
jgi:hypothetical protein